MEPPPLPLGKTRVGRTYKTPIILSALSAVVLLIGLAIIPSDDPDPSGGQSFFVFLVLMPSVLISVVLDTVAWIVFFRIPQQAPRFGWRFALILCFSLPALIASLFILWLFIHTTITSPFH